MNRTFADTDSQGEGLVVTMAAETGVRDCKPASAGVAGAARSEGTSFVEPGGERGTRGLAGTRSRTAAVRDREKTRLCP